MSFLDYTLQTKEERTKYVQNILDSMPEDKITSNLLEYLGDYILFTRDKGQTYKERKEEYPTPTKNRELTINKRQVSLEQVVSGFENGEDGLYNLMATDNSQKLDHKQKITTKEGNDIPGIKEKKKIIDTLEENLNTATGKQKGYIKNQIIETGKEIYFIRNSAQGSYNMSKSQIRTIARMNLPEEITIDEDGNFHIDAQISLLVPEHVSFLLCNYSQLKQESYDDLHGDMHGLMEDLDNIAEKALKRPSSGTVSNAILEDLIIGKIDGCSNEEIQRNMESKYGIVHNEQYYSTLGRKRIPKMISDEARREYLIGLYSNKEYHEGKQCTKCGEWKPTHPLFFSRNSTKSGYYSICKDCRN